MMKFMHFYKGMVVVITGASSGFGAEFSRQLANFADTLILVALEEELLETIKYELTSKQPSLKVDIYALDLGDEVSRNNLYQTLTRQYPEIDLLINNAGLGDTGKFQTANWQRMRKIFDVNVMALTSLTHQLVPRMCKRGKGAVLNLCSLSGLVPVPMIAVYAATKAYVSSLSEALRAETKNFGVSVTTVYPGPVDTNFGLFANRSGKKSLQGPDWFKSTTTHVVTQALRGVAHKKARIIPTFAARCLIYFFTMLPRNIRAWFFFRYIRKKKR
jgi:short-subunit dehydrogenase